MFYLHKNSFLSNGNVIVFLWDFDFLLILDIAQLLIL